MIADRHLWLDMSRTTLLEEGDPAADFCLAHRGSEVPEGEITRLGLTLDDGRVVQHAEAPPESEA